ncbi:unnamed protein product [Auanema sp. JU1783]|nr:unnamed protein product [Auanema sp. JU1783]
MKFLTILTILYNVYNVLTINIQTTYGEVKGTSLSYNDHVYYLFKKIPYAQSPTGSRRYKQPLPIDRWSHILDATKYGPACMTNSTVSTTAPKWISEDCLFINIITSERCINESCPVMAYVHGGQLNYGSAVQFNETWLIEHYVSNDIVVVLLAYRLGSFGLLMLNDASIVPRNIAILDMIEALRFNKKIIKDFGGNPSNITLMGHSSGATAISQIAFSKNIDAKAELFQSFISISGAVMWKPKMRALEITDEFIKLAKCNKRNEKEKIACLRSKEAHHLVMVQQELENSEVLFTGSVLDAPFVLENENEIDFIQNPPRRNAMFGATAKEFGPNDHEKGHLDFLGFKHEDLVKAKFDADHKKAEEDNQPLWSYESQASYVTNFVYGSELVKAGGQVYLYEFSQYPNLASHAADMIYFIGQHQRPLTNDEKIVNSFYSHFLSNFIRNEVPAEIWTPFDSNKGNYLNIELYESRNVFPTMKFPYHPDMLDYWLHNMTEFDENLNELTPVVDVRDVVLEKKSEEKTSISIMTYILFGLIILVGSNGHKWGADSPADNLPTMNYKCVVFDFGGVVMNYDSLKAVVKEISTEVNGDYDFLSKLFSHTSIFSFPAKDLFEGEITAEDLEQHMMDFAEKEHKIILPRHIRPIQDWFLKHLQYNDCVINAIEALRKNGIQTVLLTNNFYLDKKRLTPRVPVDSLFDLIIESCIEKCMKPHSQIYQLTQSRLQIDDGSQIVFLDDQAENLDYPRDELNWATIKVNRDDPQEAIHRLQTLLGISLFV